jgi:hypothetical protein
MRDPLPPDVLEQRRVDFREIVNANLQRALSLFPASMPWGQSQLERNRIELLGRTEAFQGGHIARVTEYQRFMAQRETALNSRINDEILLLLYRGFQWFLYSVIQVGTETGHLLYSIFAGGG